MFYQFISDVLTVPAVESWRRISVKTSQRRGFDSELLANETNRSFRPHLYGKHPLHSYDMGDRNARTSSNPEREHHMSNKRMQGPLFYCSYVLEIKLPSEVLWS